MTLLTASPLTKSYTADDLLRMVDSTGLELVGGQLRKRTVSKESSRVALTIGRLLANEADRTGEAEVYGADLAVEVLSPNDLIRNVNDKVEEYLSAGFGIVWVVDPVKRHVMIHRRDGSVTKLHENEEISGETALPGFRRRVAELLK